ncbi:MAG: 30S ribosomal protein S18 [Chloroflexi bacterium]|nr:30S ribosomal protein S18 [Chloroflexota bacterium]
MTTEARPPAATPGFAPRAPGTGGVGGPRRREGGRRFYPPKRRVCAFCAGKTKTIDYKDMGTLRRYLSDRNKIDTRRKTGTCAKHQRALATAIKRARILALLPFVPGHLR